MKFPRRLARTADGRYCEESDEAAAFLVGPAGMEMLDVEAERLGIAEYFRAQSVAAPVSVDAPPEAKAVEQTQTEDKAVSGPDETKAPESPPPSSTTDDPGQPQSSPRRRGT